MQYKVIIALTISLLVINTAFSLPLVNQFQHYNTEQGLSSSNVTGIIQDSQGFIWIGTDNGLNSFDGYNFSIYKKIPNDTLSLIHNQINTLFLDSRQRFWIGTNWGVSLYNRQKNNFINFFDSNGLATRKSVKTFLEDKTNNLWVVFEDGFIFKYDEKDHNFKQIYDLKMMVMSSIIDDDNNLWVGNLDGLYCFNTGNNTLAHYMHNPANKNSLSDNVIISMYLNGENLWLGTVNHGITIYNKKDHTFTRLFTEKTNIYFIYRDTMGVFWFGTSQSLMQYDIRTGKIWEYLHDSNDKTSLSSEGASSCIKDIQGNLWVGTKFGGINLGTQKKSFIFYNLKSDIPLSKNNISALLKDNKGNLWAGSFNEGIDVLIPGKNSKIQFSPDAKNPFSIGKGTVHTIFQDSRNQIWVGTFDGGLQYYEEKTGRFRSFDLGSQNQTNVLGKNIRSIAEDRNHNLWFASHGGGLCKYEPLRKKYTWLTFDPNNVDQSLANDWLFKVIVDSKGRLWIGTADGLTLMTPDEKMISFRNLPNNDQSISNNSVYTIFEDNKQRIWVGTAEGLNMFNPEQQTFTRIMKKDGLCSDNIYGILGDREGNLWLSTNDGLIKYNPDSKAIRNFDYRDGLQSNEFFINSCTQDRNGEMFFGEVNGITAFNPDSLYDNPHPPSVHLVDFKVFNKSAPIGNNKKQDILTAHVDQTEVIKLKYDQNMISFNYVALNYIAPEKNQYAYKLDGLDKDWNYVGQKREAIYTNLDPGEYIFRVKASNNDELWNEIGTAVTIKITPPFWATLWFRLLCAVLIVAGIYLFYRIRTFSIRTRTKLLEKKVQEHTFELEAANTGLVKEMNERINAEKTLLEANRRLQILQQVTAAVHQSLDLDKVFQHITDIIVNTMGYASAVILTMDDKRQCYKVVSISSSKNILSGFYKIFGPALHEINFPMDKVNSWAAKVINSRELIISKNLEDIAYPLLERSTCHTFDNLGGNKSFILIPFTKNKELMGGLIMSSAQPQIPVEDINMLKVFAHAASQAIINANLYLQTDQAREEVRKSEEKYRTLTDNMTVGIYRVTIGTRGKFIEANPALVKMFGFDSKEEFLTVDINSLYEDQEVRKSFYKRVLQQGAVKHEQFNLRKKDGSIFIASVSTVVVSDNAGKAKYYDGIIEDITERIQAAETIDKERTLLRTLIDNLPCGVFVKNKEYQKIIINPVHITEVQGRLKSLNMPWDVTLLGKSDFDIFPQELAARFFSEDQKVIINGLISLNNEEYSVNTEGSKVCLLVSKVPLRDKDGSIIGIVGITNDITDHILAIETIEKERTLLRTLIDNLPGGVFVKDKQYYKIIVNPVHVEGVHGHLKYLGMKSDIDLLGKTDFEVFPQELAEQFFSEDQKVVEQGQLILNNEEFGVNANGEQVCLSVSKVPLRDNDGSIIGMVGITVDITERKQAEEQIQKDLQEKQVLLRELYHRTKNNMQVISSMLRLHSKRGNNPQVTMILKEIENKILAMALVHQKLYESKDLSHLNLKEYFTSLIALIRMIHTNTSQHITFSVEGQDVNVLIDTAIPCGLIINELLTNSLKYAFPVKKDGHIAINLEIDKNNQLFIKVADNGIGLPKDFDFEKDINLGLESVIGLVRHQLQGEINFINEDGLACHICLKEDSYKPKN